MARNRRKKRYYGPRIFDYIEAKTFFIILSILLGMIVLVLLFISFRSTSEMNKLAKQTEELNHKFEQIYDESSEPNGQVEQQEVDPQEVISLTILGDIYCTTDMISDAYRNDNHQYDFHNMFGNIQGLVQEADLAIGTVGTNFTKEDYTSGTRFNSPTEFADALSDIGLDVVNTATDHAGDFGQEGYQETNNYWRQKGLTVAGEKQEENNLIVHEVKGMKIAFLSYLQKGILENESISVETYQKEIAQKQIEYAKQNADYVIVFMHWSSINQSFASTRETNLADELVSLGADMVLGSHSNYVQQMQVKQNQQGKNTFVSYSLGNYLFQTTDYHTQAELVLKVELRKSEEDGKLYLKKVDYVPIYAVDNGKSAENRFEYIDLKGKVESYTEEPTNEEEKVKYKQMKDTLEWIEKVIVGG